MNAGTLRLVPLGGLGEFGLNALVLDWEGHLLLVDAGVMFPSAEQPGVESIVPDYAYLKQRPGALEAIVLTHGHEDHIGSLSFALQAAPAPVYGSRLTLGFTRRRLQERGMQADLRLMAPGQVIEAGPFRIHPIHVAHSVVDSLALAIETPAGVVLASGDFKIDPTAAPNERTDLAALKAWGDRGVLALLSDSTNAEQRGHTGTEDDLLPAFRQVFADTPGRVLVTCFATSMPRIQRVAELALAAGRKLAFIGRRMADNAEVALDLGCLRLPESALLASGSVGSQAPGSLALFVSGSQGEPFSALSLVAQGEHNELAVGPGDTAVFSARVIPGHERAVSAVMGNLFRRGCDVVHPGTAKVHVSGHGNQDDLVELLQAVRPRYLVPVHGEYRMLAQHARLAVRAGFPESRVMLAEDGDVIALGPEAAVKDARVAAGRVLLDRSGAAGLEDVVLRERRQLSFEGIVVPVVLLGRQTGRVEAQPELVSRGFVQDGEPGAGLWKDAREVLVAAAEAGTRDLELVRENLRVELRRFFRRRTGRRPLVVPVVMEV